MLYKLMTDESGVIISAELVLVLTIAVLGMIVGLSEVAVAANTELNDISNAIGALNQSYAFTGFHGYCWKFKSFFSGSCFIDTIDDCDFNSTCDLVCGAGFGGGGGGGGVGGGGGGMGMGGGWGG
jgi:hypothetical protein